ncbi:MAG: hypothetical protein ACKV0T_29285 [Planctomycetales bacterium]
MRFVPPGDDARGPRGRAELRQWHDRGTSEADRLFAAGKTAPGEPLAWDLRLTLELLRAESARTLVSGSHETVLPTVHSKALFKGP